ncbi:MAG: hypothetical protein K2X03_03535 [Bryobacteraceae bacterium]|nr:hypothetical protein [Bryobacteraceae bacterium]
MKTLILIALLAQKDFLTPDEVERIREAQEPNLRLTLYTNYAKQRLDLLKQLFAKEKAGRSILIYNQLDQYTKIIEAIDTVADDALRRKQDLTLGIAEVAKAEEKMLAELQKFAATEPKDLARYEFVLKTAIETTQDSLEASQQDLKDRGRTVTEREATLKKEREALLTTEDKKEKEAAEKKSGETERKTRKAPTLRKKGEVPPP